MIFTKVFVASVVAYFALPGLAAPAPPPAPAPGAPGNVVNNIGPVVGQNQYAPVVGPNQAVGPVAGQNQLPIVPGAAPPAPVVGAVGAGVPPVAGAVGAPGVGVVGAAAATYDAMGNLIPPVTPTAAAVTPLPVVPVLTTSFCSIVEIGARKDCGFAGITPGECITKACCFDSSVIASVWCYYPSPTNEIKQVTPPALPPLGNPAVIEGVGAPGVVAPGNPLIAKPVVPGAGVPPVVPGAGVPPVVPPVGGVPGVVAPNVVYPVIPAGGVNPLIPQGVQPPAIPPIAPGMIEGANCQYKAPNVRIDIGHAGINKVACLALPQACWDNAGKPGDIQCYHV